MCFVLHQGGKCVWTIWLAFLEGMGYGDGPFGATSIAIEIDTYANVQQRPWFDHIAINSGGNVDHNLAVGLCKPTQTTATLKHGQTHTFRVSWNPADSTLEVYFNGVLRQTLTLDLVGNIFNGNPLVNWGWTGTTGGATNVHSFCLGDASYSTVVDSVTLEATAFCDCLGNTLDVLGICGGGFQQTSIKTAFVTTRKSQDACTRSHPITTQLPRWMTAAAWTPTVVILLAHLCMRATMMTL